MSDERERGHVRALSVRQEQKDVVCPEHGVVDRVFADRWNGGVPYEVALARHVREAH